MKNSHYYKNELETVIDEWLDKMTEDPLHPFKWIGNNLSSNMMEAAFAVLKGSVDVQEFLEQENLMEPI